jgi:hypothetical protein
VVVFSRERERERESILCFLLVCIVVDLV